MVSDLYSSSGGVRTSCYGRVGSGPMTFFFGQSTICGAQLDDVLTIFSILISIGFSLKNILL